MNEKLTESWQRAITRATQKRRFEDMRRSFVARMQQITVTSPPTQGCESGERRTTRKGHNATPAED